MTSADPFEIAGGTLYAEKDDPRTFRARLVPFGELATSNLGKFRVGKGVLQLPDDPATTMQWNDGHDREHPVARTLLLAERDDGIWAKFRVADGPQGDQMVRDIKDGKRRHVSVEAADMVIRAGQAVAGRIFGAAIVSEGKLGAFPSATLLAMRPAGATLLADADDDVEDPEDPTVSHDSSSWTDPTTGQLYEVDVLETQTVETDPDSGVQTTTNVTTRKTTITPGKQPAQQEGPQVTQPVPAAPQDALFAQNPGTGIPPTLLHGRPQTPQGKAARSVNARTLYAMLAQAAPAFERGAWDPERLAALNSKEVKGTLFAELTDITFSAAGSPVDMIVPQWAGEIWSGNTWARRWIPLFTTADLTGPTVKGWQWVTKPVVEQYAGNKTDVPSGPIGTKPLDIEAQPFAMAHDVDRRFRDFSVPEFWAGYLQWGATSYSQQSDLYVPETIFASATNYTAVQGLDVPTGISPVWGKIVDGALAIINHGTPSFAVVGAADYRSLLLTPQLQGLEYLSAALKLDGGELEGFTIMPHAADAGTAMNAGQVFVGAKEAVTVYELPGSPIRIEGIDVAQGGIDPGLFGYVAVRVNAPQALALVTPPSS